MNPLAIGLAFVIVAVLGIVYVLLREQGPNPVIVLLGRYTALPFVLLATAPVALVGLVVAPTRTLVTLAAIVWALLTVGVLLGWGPGTVARAVRRIKIRSMWPSVARSAGLAVTNDRRSRSWPGGVTTTTLNAQTIEHLPRIWGGRALPGGVGVVYKLRPAKGATIADVGGASMALAAALGVQRINVPNAKRPSRGELRVLYRDALTGGK